MDIPKGNVRIGQKRRRGITGDKNPTYLNYRNIDVTSGGMNIINNIRTSTLSPLKLGPVYIDGIKIAEKFENYWQYGKMWKKAGHIKDRTDSEPTNEWFRFRKEGYEKNIGKRRPFPKSKGYGNASTSRYNNKTYDYITSRKKIYVPIYANLIRNLPIMKELQKLINNGINILIIDGDGPPKSTYPEGLPMNIENWNKMINDPIYPFGHGYIVAALLSGLNVPELYGLDVQELSISKPINSGRLNIRKSIVSSSQKILTIFHSRPNQDYIDFDTKANDNILKMIKDRNWKKMFEIDKIDAKIINEVEVADYPQWRIFTKGNEKLALVITKEMSPAQRDFTKEGVVKIIQPTWNVTKEAPPKYKNLIILTYKNLGNSGRQYIKQQGKIKFLRIEHFRVENMAINIIDHYLQPKFRKLDKIEISVLRKKYSDLHILPIMKIEDPIAIWYDYKDEDIIEITRSIPEKHIYYRRVSSFGIEYEEENGEETFVSSIPYSIEKNVNFTSTS